MNNGISVVESIFSCWRQRSLNDELKTTSCFHDLQLNAAAFIWSSQLKKEDGSVVVILAINWTCTVNMASKRILYSNEPGNRLTRYSLPSLDWSCAGCIWIQDTVIKPFSIWHVLHIDTDKLSVTVGYHEYMNEFISWAQKPTSVDIICRV